jgi:hypothetical protein
VKHRKKHVIKYAEVTKFDRNPSKSLGSVLLGEVDGRAAQIPIFQSAQFALPTFTFILAPSRKKVPILLYNTLNIILLQAEKLPMTCYQLPYSESILRLVILVSDLSWSCISNEFTEFNVNVNKFKWQKITKRYYKDNCGVKVIE